MNSIFKVVCFVFSIALNFSLFAQEDDTPKFTNDQISACGKAQLTANYCITSKKSGMAGELIGGLTSKLSMGDLGKTASDKASGEAANALCKKLIEKASADCNAPK